MNIFFFCTKEDELVDHILLHCTQARGLWNVAFYLFGVVWVMSFLVKEILLGWHNSYVDKKRDKGWRVFPLRVF